MLTEMTLVGLLMMRAAVQHVRAWPTLTRSDGRPPSPRAHSRNPPVLSSAIVSADHGAAGGVLCGRCWVRTNVG